MKKVIALSFILTATAQAASDCKEVHIFLAKGNNEPYPGRQGKLAGAICSDLKSCDYEDIQFYNPVEAPYCDSVFEGAKNGIQQITDYNRRCPEAKLVVSGYSQGGHIVGDILGGGGGVFFQDCVQEGNEGLDPVSRPANKIIAAMIFGDTRHTADQPFNVLTGADKDGLFPRPGDQLANLAKYGDVLRNYCVETDPICAQGDEVETHLNYFDVFTDEAAGWVKERIKAARNEDDTATPAVSTRTRKGAVTTTADTVDETTTTVSNEETTRTSKSSSKTSTTADKDTISAEETSASTTDDATTAAETSEASTTEDVDSQTTQAPSESEAALSDAAEPSSTGNGASSPGVSFGGVLMGLAAILAI
ncbi:hypothetical protein ACJ41O_000915 [Fusarium nematophilum]